MLAETFHGTAAPIHSAEQLWIIGCRGRRVEVVRDMRVNTSLLTSNSSSKLPKQEAIDSMEHPMSLVTAALLLNETFGTAWAEGNVCDHSLL